MNTIDRIPISKVERASNLVQTGAKVGVNYLKYYGNKLATTEVKARKKLNELIDIFNPSHDWIFKLKYAELIKNIKLKNSVVNQERITQKGGPNVLGLT